MEDNKSIEAVTEVVNTNDVNKSWSKETWQGIGLGMGALLGVEYILVPGAKAAWKTAKAWYKNRKIKKEQAKEKMENLAEEIVTGVKK